MRDAGCSGNGGSFDGLDMKLAARASWPVISWSTTAAVIESLLVLTAGLITSTEGSHAFESAAVHHRLRIRSLWKPGDRRYTHDPRITHANA